VTAPSGTAAYRALRLPHATVSVVVDVEEEFDWSAPFSSDSGRVDAVRWIHLGHTALQALGIRPAYLLTYPIARSEIAAGLFREMVADGSCEIGAQLHPWVTPPIEETISDATSYPSNLPVDLERRKNERLIAAIEDALGVRPLIYKAGRYGLDLRRADMLAGLGFRVDTSVMPFQDLSGTGGGPDFFGIPSAPFWMDRDEQLLALPSTQELVGMLAGRLPISLLRVLYAPRMERLRIPGVLSRLGLLERLRLSPEGYGFENARRLIDACCARGSTCFVLSFHSPSLKPGCTPYVRSEAELVRFVDTIHLTLRYLIEGVGARPTSVLELYGQLRSQARAATDGG
jgi:hypothetical protein